MKIKIQTPANEIVPLDDCGGMFSSIVFLLTESRKLGLKHTETAMQESLRCFLKDMNGMENTRDSFQIVEELLGAAARIDESALEVFLNLVSAFEAEKIRPN